MPSSFFQFFHAISLPAAFFAFFFDYDDAATSFISIATQCAYFASALSAPFVCFCHYDVLIAYVAGCFRPLLLRRHAMI